MKAKQIYENYPNYKLDEVRKEMVACEAYETVEEIDSPTFWPHVK